MAPAIPLAESSRTPTLKSLWIWTRGFAGFLPLVTLFLLLRLFFSRRSLDRLLKLCCRVFVRLLGIRVQVEGLERIDRNRHYTFMVNHVTALDHFVLYGVVPHFGRGLEAAKNFRIPLYGWFARAVDNYPIERKVPATARVALETCAREAKEQGFSVYCAPEGTRSRDGFLGPLKNGIFRLALACDREIVPIALIDFHPVLPPGEWHLRLQPVTLRVLDPISVRNVTGEPLSIKELKEHVWEAFISAGLVPRGS